jgi:CheY-like chemotaxis protein
MNKETGRAPIILVVEGVEETRDGIERLLKADGYLVDPARNEEDAVVRAKRQHPDLILASPGSPRNDIIAAAGRIRRRARLGNGIPVVIFGVETMAEGGEEEIGKNIHITRPDNFDQLRNLLSRLLPISHCLRPAVDQILL